MRFKINWASFIFEINIPILLCFTLYLRAIFQVQALGGGGLYLEGRFNGGFFALPVWGLVFILEGLIFEILWHSKITRIDTNNQFLSLFNK